MISELIHMKEWLKIKSNIFLLEISSPIKSTLTIHGISYLFIVLYDERQIIKETFSTGYL